MGCLFYLVMYAMRNFEAHNGPQPIRKQAGPLDFGSTPGQDDPDPNWDWGAEMAQNPPRREPDALDAIMPKLQANPRTVSETISQLEEIIEQIQVGGVQNLDAAAQRLKELRTYIQATGLRPYISLLDHAAEVTEGSALEMDQDGYGWASPDKIKELTLDLEDMLRELQQM